MKRILSAVLCAASALMLPVGSAVADTEGNWKLGRIYYRASCTGCHNAELGKSVSPATMTIAEWTAWIDTDETGAHFNDYVSQSYRAEIAPENKVAEKFSSLTDGEMWAHTRAFVLYGAKDSANPATCD